MANHVAMEATLPYCIWLQWYVPVEHLFASQHCWSTYVLSQILVYKTLKCLTFNLTYTVSHGTHGTHVVIYMPVFTKNEDTELSLGLFMNVAI